MNKYHDEYHENQIQTKIFALKNIQKKKKKNFKTKQTKNIINFNF